MKRLALLLLGVLSCTLPTDNSTDLAAKRFRAASITTDSVVMSPSADTLAVGDVDTVVGTAYKSGAPCLSCDIAFVVPTADTARLKILSLFVPAGGTGDRGAVVQAKALGSARLQGGNGGVRDTTFFTISDNPPPPPPPDSVVDGCPTSGYLRLVDVSTSSELTSAILNAIAGDEIRLAPGTYNAFYNPTASGTSAHPIVVCGPKSANVGNTGTTPTGMNIKLQASYWVFRGFTMQNVFQPIFIMGNTGKGDFNEVYDVDFINTGNSAVRLKNQASHNKIHGNNITNTGINDRQFGEAVYVGTTQSKWATENGGVPDKSDSNEVYQNTLGPDIGSDCYDIKEGTTGTRVWGNHCTTKMLTPGTLAFAHHFGNKGYDSANVFINPDVASSFDFPNGLYVETTVTGWGQNTRIVADSLFGDSAPGKGVLVGNGSKATTVLKCSTEVSGFALYSNLSPVCQ